MKNSKRMRWDVLSEGILAQRVEGGLSEAEIAEELGCTEKAVNLKKFKLGIRHKPAHYCAVSPSGKRIESDSFAKLVREHWLEMGEAGDPPKENIRRSRPCMGLNWALKTGRSWKGWSVELVEGSSKPGRRNA